MLRNIHNQQILTLTPWQGRHAFDSVLSLNLRLIDLLAKHAQREKNCTRQIIHPHRNLWCTLDPAMRQRAAQIPILLINMNFQTADWWECARAQRDRTHKETSENFLPARVAVELARETLMLAWHVAGTGSGAARALLGMSEPVSLIFAEFIPGDIERLSANQARHLRPRWDTLPDFWGSLLSAAKGGDAEALRTIHMRGLRLLGSELMSNSGYLSKPPKKK